MKALVVACAICAAVAPAIAIGKKPPVPPQFVVVRKLPPEAVMQRTQLFCIQNGLSVTQTSATQIVCSKPMDDSLRSMFFRALVTPSYSTNPVFYYQVTAVRLGDNTTVSANQYFRYQNAYGQETNEPLNNRKDLTAIGQGLQQMKTNWETRLAAHNDDEAAALASADASLAAAGGMVANQQSASTPTGAPTSAATAVDHPSAAAAKQALAQVQCADSFRLVGESAGKALFEAKCAGGSIQLMQCLGMVCKPLQ